MTVTTWSDPGTKVYETGLDRGIIYTDDGAVPWNGLTAVNRDPFIASKDPLYLDGLKYGEKVVYQPLSGTITAYTYPDELLAYQGVLHTHNGMYFNEQPANGAFGLSYRTKIGNDLDGIDHGYKLHLVYNVSVIPDPLEFSSISEDADPSEFSWAYSTTPIAVNGYRPLSHLEIDSRKTPDGFMEYIEGILYGTPGVAARQPTLQQMLSLMYNGPGTPPDEPSHYPSNNQYPSSNFYPGDDAGSPTFNGYPSSGSYPSGSNYPGNDSGGSSNTYTPTYLAAY
jgi:hypothetical protein